MIFTSFNFDEIGSMLRAKAVAAGCRAVGELLRPLAARSPLPPDECRTFHGIACRRCP